ncbi:MAG: EpsG family protein [Clostridia bacterium]|nr:EpsG family protein [Clostridia bacterium]MBQ8766766.1 EpsG family protein [Clostridia bacterium]
MESLEYYLLLVAIMAFGVLMPQGTKDRKQYIVIMTVLHSLLSGLRHPYLTGDMQSYCYNYWRITDQGWFSEEVFQEGKNFGFNWLMKFFSILSDGEFQVFLIVVAIFIEVVVAYLIYKYSSLPWLSFLVWNCMGFYSFGFSAIKQSIAMGLIMIAFVGIMEERPKQFVLFTVLATFVHKPSLIFLPAYYLSKRKFTLPTFLIYICSATVIFVNKNQIVKLMQDFYYEEDVIGDSADLGGRFFLILLFIIAGFALRGFNGKYFSKVANLMVAAAVLQMFSGFDNVFTRLTDYYLQFLIIFVPLSFADYKDEKLEGISEGIRLDILPKQKFAIIILLAIFLVWYYNKCYIDVDINIYDDYTNYRFFWEEWLTGVA